MIRQMTSFLTPKKNLGEKYTPSYFLASLGNGGIAVTFFIYLNFMVPHPTTPIITFDGLAAFMADAAFPIRFLIIFAMIGIALFAVRHFWLLGWNLRELALFRKTPAYDKLRQSNNETKLMSLPLTLAMAINVSFAAGAALTPGLWNIVEYMFPFALLAFFAVGVMALHAFISFFSRILAKPEFDCSSNNSLAQLIAIFTFGMVGVGAAAPASMSLNAVTVTVSIIAGTFFMSIAVILGLVWFVLGFRSMIDHGISKESSVTLWIPLPIITLIGIGIIRVAKGLSFLFHTPTEATNAVHAHAYAQSVLIPIIIMFTLQILFAILGYAVMDRVGYFKTFVSGQGRSVDSYALICPGVAFFVFGMFFVHVGLIHNGLLDKFSVPYFVILVPLIASQIFAIVMTLQLDEKLLRPQNDLVFESGDTESEMAAT